MVKPYDSIYGEIEFNLQEKAFSMCGIKYVDVVKNLHFRKCRETLYNLQKNPTGKFLSKMWGIKISEAFRSTL